MKARLLVFTVAPTDLTVNCLTGKKLTNMRASGTDEAVILVPPIKMSLEQALEFIDDDELVERHPNLYPYP